MTSDSTIITYLENRKDQATKYFEEYDNAEAMHEMEVISALLESLKNGAHLASPPVNDWPLED